MSAVPVSESGVRPILAEAVEQARRALLDLEPAGVGPHLGVTAEDEASATHHFEATLPGYRGWQWAVVVAAPPEADHVTVSESALLPGPDALVAPDFIPWDQRVRPGDLAPGDLLAPPLDDPRLVPGYMQSGDPAIDEVALDLGLGRSQVLSREGRTEAADRWFSEFGPETDMARAAPSTCGLCGFFVPLAGSLRAAFGVCANAMGADGHVVHTEYGCGAHSDTVLPTGNGSPLYEAYDDGAIELIPAAEFRKLEESVNAPAVEADSTPPAADTAAEADSTSAASPAVEEDSAPPADADPAAAENTATVADATSAADPAAEADSVVTEDLVGEPTTEATAQAEPLVESTAAVESTDAAEADVPAEADSSTETAGEAATADPEAQPATDSAAPAEAAPAADPAARETNSVADEASPSATSGLDEAAAAAVRAQPARETGEITLFDFDPDAGPYDDAWGVAAVKVEPQTGEPGTSGPN